MPSIIQNVTVIISLQALPTEGQTTQAVDVAPAPRHRCAITWSSVNATTERSRPLCIVITIGLDLAKHWFQVHGIDAAGKMVVRAKTAPRGSRRVLSDGQEPCLVGMEACATAHHWARELIALGHEVKLMPPAYVKAYVKRNKNDAADAEAICKAVTRPSMRFVPVKDVDQQSVLMMHRARNLLVRQRTMRSMRYARIWRNLAIVAPQGLRHIERLVACDRRGQSRAAGACAVDPSAHRGAVRRYAGQSPSDRGETGQMASQQSGQQIAGDGSRRWNHEGQCNRSHGLRSEPVPVGTRIRGLARHDAAPEFLRRQRAAGTNQQTGRQIHSLFAGRGGRRRSAACARSGDKGRRMGARDSGAKAGQSSSRSRSPTEPPASSGR